LAEIAGAEKQAFAFIDTSSEHYFFLCLDLPPSDVHFFGLKKGYVQIITSGLSSVLACGQRNVVSLSDTPFAFYCQQKVYVKWGLLQVQGLSPHARGTP
jgi:hypothetical protein